MSMLLGVTAKLNNFSNCKIFFAQTYAGAFENVVRDPTIRETDTGESFSNISALASICFSYCYVIRCFDVLLTVHLSIFISVINQLHAQNLCFAIGLFNASTCFEHMCSSSGGQEEPLVSSHL